MLRSACIFLAAILLPSFVLAWLAVRSARDQQVLAEHQQAIISQDVADNLAKIVRTQVDALRSEFVQVTQGLLEPSSNPQVLARHFDLELRKIWSPAEVGFAVDLKGTIYSPNRSDDPAARMFREENERFLSNRENVEAYSSLNSQDLVAQRAVHSAPAGSYAGGAHAVSGQIQSPAPVYKIVPPTPATVVTTDALSKSTVASLSGDNRSVVSSATLSPGGTLPESTVVTAGATQTTTLSTPDETTRLSSPSSGVLAGTGSVDSSTSSDKATGALTLAQPATSSTPAAEGPNASPADYQPTTQIAKSASQVARQVSPANNLKPSSGLLSNTVPEESDFRRLIGNDSSGVIARFLDNKLQLLVWSRPSLATDFVFGAQLDQSHLRERLRAVLQAPEFKAGASDLLSRNATPGFCVAVLDDTGHPVAVSLPGFTTDWKHPFVATEIGEALPHWEAALYLTDPHQLSNSARTLQLTIGLIVVLLVAAIVIGGSLIATDIRRQVRLAQQKTDFVSNVSHELKTPLTSIRMFADLLAEGRVTEPARQLTYLKIISAESARLTRLINNVLDFARQERGVSNNERRPCDLVETTRDVVETCLPHLEASGQQLVCEIEAESLPITGDRDALAQIVLNLISNAEKYGGGDILVRIRRQETSAGALGCVDVLDHGPGIPPKEVESIFLPFHRLHDSLANGTPGSGLGLTLARRMARVHGGDISYSPRAGGGSCFTLTIPLTA